MHFLRKGKNVKILTSIIRGTIIDGSRCSLTRFAFFFFFFCKFDAENNNRSSNSNFHMLKRKVEESFNGDSYSASHQL